MRRPASVRHELPIARRPASLGFATTPRSDYAESRTLSMTPSWVAWGNGPIHILCRISSARYPAIQYSLGTVSRHTLVTALALRHGPVCGCHRRDQTPAPPLRRPPLWLFRRRALLPGLRATPRLGLCRPAAAHRAGGETCTPHARRFAAGHPPDPGARRHGQRAAGRVDGARTGRPPLRPGAGGAGGSAGARLSGARQPFHHERVRAAHLDGLRLRGDPHHPHRKREAVVMVWSAGRRRSGEQALHADLRLRHRRGTGAHPRTALAALAVASLYAMQYAMGRLSVAEAHTTSSELPPVFQISPGWMGWGHATGAAV